MAEYQWFHLFIFCFNRQQKKEEETTVVSEIVDCDTKSLPDVIPSTVLENLSSNSANCDITANLSSVDMDVSADTESDARTETTMGENSAEMDVTEEVENQSGLVQVDQLQSVEEKRAEHYLNKEEQGRETSQSTEDSSAVSSSLQTTEQTCDNSSDENRVNIQESNLGNPTENSESSEQSPNTETTEVHIHLDNSSDFDTFQFWRTPIPQVDIDLDTLNKEDSPATETLQISSSDQQMFEDSRDLSAALSSSLSDLTVCDNQSVLLSDFAGIEPISSGDNTETTMSVIDGVVQGKSGCCLKMLYPQWALSIFLVSVWF